MTVPTPIELRATLVTLVAALTATRCAAWEPLVGDRNPHSDADATGSNWRIAVKRTLDERDALAGAIAMLRDDHPRIGWARPGDDHRGEQEAVSVLQPA